jgi:small subunit ribosomal protein S1
MHKEIETIEISKVIDNFDWNIPASFVVNKTFSTPRGVSIYSHEAYAESLYKIYSKSTLGITSSKDLESGQLYKCKISSVSEKTAIAYTDSGQSIIIDVKKEEREAEKMGLTGLDFTPGSELSVIVKEIKGSYYGSASEGFTGSVREEFHEQIKSESLAYPAKIKSINRGGYLVDVSGVECFLPGSLAAANKISDFESYIGKTLYVMVDGYVAEKDIFVVSHKKYLAHILPSKLRELELNRTYKGTVTGKSDFGVFVEWDEIFTGLVHKSDFPDEKVTDFYPGQEIEFYVTEVKDDGKITLSLNGPSERSKLLYNMQSLIDRDANPEFDAIVKFRRRNGALVEIPENGLFALIPSDELHPEDRKCKIGDELTISVYAVEIPTNKIFARSI